MTLCPETWRPWDFLGRTFRLKGPTLGRSLMRILDTISTTVFDAHVCIANNSCPMNRLVRKEKVSKTIHSLDTRQTSNFSSATDQLETSKRGTSTFQESTKLSDTSWRCLFYQMAWQLIAVRIIQALLPISTSFTNSSPFTIAPLRSRKRMQTYLILVLLRMTTRTSRQY